MLRGPGLNKLLPSAYPLESCLWLHVQKLGRAVGVKAKRGGKHQPVWVKVPVSIVKLGKQQNLSLLS